MYDFCLSFPYAAVLAVGGLLGFVLKGSVVSLGSGLGSAAAFSGLGYLSLSYYKSKQLCKPATAASFALAVMLTLVMYKRFRLTGHFIPAGLVCGISALMAGFYAWSFVAGPKPAEDGYDAKKH